MTNHKLKRSVYHDGDGILRHIDPEEEEKRILDLDNRDKEDDDKNIGENID
jgi:hypothetical protein